MIEVIEQPKDFRKYLRLTDVVALLFNPFDVNKWLDDIRREMSRNKIRKGGRSEELPWALIEPFIMKHYFKVHLAITKAEAHRVIDKELRRLKWENDDIPSKSQMEKRMLEMEDEYGKPPLA